jgi:iron complex transport system ATP-binding protein
VGLIGHNGSGKSTLLKLLARQQPASDGSIRFAGQALHAWGNREFARKVAYLPQQTPPAASMLVRELVALGRYPWHGALGRFTPNDRERVAEAMALTDVTPFAERLVDTLSGGERQRVWIAMLVAQDAECLLLDEPIAALDIAHQVEMLALVRRLAIDRSLGVIIVLHDVNMAARYCDEIIALHSGRLIARGPPRDIMTPAGLEAIYGIPMAVMPHPNSGIPISFLR